MNVTVKQVLGRQVFRRLVVAIAVVAATAAAPRAAAAQESRPGSAAPGGEAALVVPDLSTVDFRGVSADSLLMGGLVVCGLGLVFGLMTFNRLKALPVHTSMR